MSPLDGIATEFRQTQGSPLIVSVVCFAATTCWFQTVGQTALAGIPEPGSLRFFSIANTAAPCPLPMESMAWQITKGPSGESVTTEATLADVNDQLFHFVRVPCGTRSVGGRTLEATPNVLRLSELRNSYSWAALLGTNDCAFITPSQSSFTFSKAARGGNDRVRLAITIPGFRINTDGDGIHYGAAVMAGTDPRDPN